MKINQKAKGDTAMKTRRLALRLAVLALCVLLIIPALVSCKGGIKGVEARTLATQFITLLGDGKYDEAETLFHPTRPADLVQFAEAIEADGGIRFGDGAEIDQYTNFKNELYDSEVNGALYVLSFKGTAGGDAIHGSIEIVRNDDGYGIYNFTIAND